MLQQAAAAAMTAASLTIESLFSPPQSVRGLKKLDKSLFEKRVRVPAVALEGRKIPSFRRYLSEVTLNVPGVKWIRDTKTEKVRLDCHHVTTHQLLIVSTPLILDLNFLRETGCHCCM